MKKQYQVIKIDEEKLKTELDSNTNGWGVRAQLYKIKNHIHIFNMDYDPNQIGGYKTTDNLPIKVPETEEGLFLKAVASIGAEAKEIGEPVFD